MGTIIVLMLHVWKQFIKLEYFYWKFDNNRCFLGNDYSRHNFLHEPHILFMLSKPFTAGIP
jgi:hypothetical protein